MPAITTQKVNSNEITDSVHQEYFAEDQFGAFISANSSGYMLDLETDFNIPSGANADVIILLTVSFTASSTSEQYPYAAVNFGIELDGVELRDATIKPLAFRGDNFTTRSAINGSLVAAKKNVSSGSHNIKVPYSSGDSQINSFCRSIQTIVFYK